MTGTKHLVVKSLGIPYETYWYLDRSMERGTDGRKVLVAV